MGRATTLEEFKDALRDCGTTLWVNSTYADDRGNAYYIDSSSVPNLSPLGMLTVSGKIAASAAYRSLYQNGLVLLEATSRDDWVQGACRGLVPFADRPQLERRDFVQNSNDSYWVTNPAAPLEGRGEGPAGGDGAATGQRLHGLRQCERPRLGYVHGLVAAAEPGWGLPPQHGRMDAV